MIKKVIIKYKIIIKILDKYIYIKNIENFKKNLSLN